MLTSFMLQVKQMSQVKYADTYTMLAAAFLCSHTYIMLSLLITTSRGSSDFAKSRKHSGPWTVTPTHINAQLRLIGNWPSCC